ncbi:MAG: hypothetical protein KQJ78_25635, partial [Deltaproteobacteria bacterium]|nr:hypothetical protein [Deltaproteobacteria bacterium]
MFKLVYVLLITRVNPAWAGSAFSYKKYGHHKQGDIMHMENQKKGKILLACDGSERFLKTARYVSKFEMFYPFHFVLFHVFRNVPKSYWDLERNPKDLTSQASIKAWEYQNR